MKVKAVLYVIFFLLFCLSETFAQKCFQQYTLLHNERFNVSLTLNDDHTFTQFVIARFSDMNFSLKGKWHKKGRKIILRDDLGFTKARTEVDSSFEANRKTIIIHIADSSNLPLSDIAVRLTLPERRTYQYFKSDRSGTVIIDKDLLNSRSEEKSIINVYDRGWYLTPAISDYTIRRIEEVQIYGTPRIYKIRGKKLFPVAAKKPSEIPRTSYSLPLSGVYQRL